MRFWEGERGNEKVSTYDICFISCHDKEEVGILASSGKLEVAWRRSQLIWISLPAGFEDRLYECPDERWNYIEIEYGNVWCVNDESSDEQRKKSIFRSLPATQ